MGKRRRRSRKRRGLPAGAPGSKGHEAPGSPSILLTLLSDPGCYGYLIALTLLALGFVIGVHEDQPWWLLLGLPILGYFYVDKRESTRANRQAIRAVFRRFRGGH